MNSVGKYYILTYRHSRLLPDAISIGVVFIVPSSEKPFVVNRIFSYTTISKVYKENEGSFLASFLKVFEKRVDDLNKKFSNDNLFGSLTELELNLKAILPENSGAFNLESPTSLAFTDVEKDIAFFTQKIIGHHLQNDSARTRLDDYHLKLNFAQQLKQIDASQREKVKTDYTVKTESVDLKFDFAWKNGKVNLVSAVGFDYADDSSIDEKAFKWFGRLNHLNSLQAGYVPNLLISKPEPSHIKAFNKAYKLLKAAPTKTKFFEQKEFSDYISEINKEAKTFI